MEQVGQVEHLVHGGDPTLGDQLIRSLRLLQNAAHRAPRLHPDVDPMSVPLLFKVAREPDRISAIAASFHAELSTVSRQITHLTDLGLLRKEPDPADGRAFVVAVTDAGLELCARLRARRDGWLDSVLADWSPSDRHTLTTLLGRLADAVEGSDLEHLKEQP